MAKKSLILLLFVVFLSAIANAQTTNKIALSISGDVDFGSTNGNAGPGFTLKTELPLAAKLKLTVSAGYLSNTFPKRLYDLPAVLYTSTYYNINTPNTPSGPTGPANNGPYEFIPVKAGLRYYYFNSLYVDAEAGEAFKANVTNNSFVYGGNFGGFIPFSKHSAFDISAGYSRGYHLQDYNEKIGEYALRLGYRYQF